MTTTTTTKTAATTATLQRGFPSLPCILCGHEGNLSVGLEDVRNFYCGECSGDFDRDTLDRHLRKWHSVLDWLDTAPAIVE